MSLRNVPNEFVFTENCKIISRNYHWIIKRFSFKSTRKTTEFPFNFSDCSLKSNRLAPLACTTSYRAAHKHTRTHNDSQWHIKFRGNRRLHSAKSRLRMCEFAVRGTTMVTTTCVAHCRSVLVLHSDSEQVEIRSSDFLCARSLYLCESKEKQTKYTICSNFDDNSFEPVKRKWGVECLW